jgi:hypothetical protein
LVWPVKAEEVEVLADCVKLVGVVEKHMYASERCSFPA